MSTTVAVDAINIGGRAVGKDAPAFLIAELSGNHNGSFERALQMVHAAAESGADAIKLQTYTADTITIRCDAAPFRIAGGTLWDGKSLHQLYSEAYTPWEWQPKLKQAAEDLGMLCFSSAFDESAVDFLEGIHVPAHKLASFELVDLPLIRKMAATGKPLFLSTGMATLDEIEEAVNAAVDAGSKEIALLKCCSAYPAPPEEINLRTIPELARHFDVPVGLSDHTMGIAVPVAAVTLGACIVEKHFALARSDGGPDSAFSLEPQEFKAMVEAVRTAEKALGDVRFGTTEEEDRSRIFRRSLFVVRDIKKGDRFTADNVRSIRPGNGLHTRHINEVLSKVAAKDIRRGTPLSWELVS